MTARNCKRLCPHSAEWYWWEDFCFPQRTYTLLTKGGNRQWLAIIFMPRLLVGDTANLL